tara:strand:- start:21 stop:248 length:228 start_codon:yes stop_codon:yes gene_type:complete
MDLLEMIVEEEAQMFQGQIDCEQGIGSREISDCVDRILEAARNELDEDTVAVITAAPEFTIRPMINDAIRNMEAA